VVVDDATHEAVGVDQEHTLGADQLTRILDRILCQRRRPLPGSVGKRFNCEAMLTWVHRHGDELAFFSSRRDGLVRMPIVESFNGRLQDECLNEPSFTSLSHARVVIETWRREYNEGGPRKSLGGLTPAAYAMQLATKAATMTVKI